MPDEGIGNRHREFTWEGYRPIDMKKVRMLSIGLAMSLMFAQTSQAAVFITPFGTTEVYDEGAVQESTSAVVPETGETEIGPGFSQETGENPGAQAPGAGNQSGPGADKQETSQAVTPSAGYSTTDPVQVILNRTGVENGEIAEPEISAEGAVLYDVTHDKFLFEKNADKRFYPASITKLLTALLVLENADFNETVTFSQNAVTRLESGAVTLQIQEGDRVSVKDCLYGLLLKSANEVANGLAEHVGGTIYGFADMMNAKAASLGCTGSHFVNPNGLNDQDHYTTARDMAKIAKAAFANEKLCEIASTTSYKFPATKAAGERTITMGHKMLFSSDSRYYEGIVGGKTGYTSLAGNTLVTCVERDGVRMIAVILQARSTHYTDTKALLDYGYALNAAGTLTQSGSGNQDVFAGPGAGGSQAGTSAGSGNASQTMTAYHKWIADGDIWRFELADGTRLSNCFVTIDGKEYAFDTEGRMVTGWLALGTNWHYFGSNGAMIRGDWRQDGGFWFYLGGDGAMVKNAWIDNRYYVGEDGIWVEQEI